MKTILKLLSITLICIMFFTCASESLDQNLIDDSLNISNKQDSICSKFEF